MKDIKPYSIGTFTADDGRAFPAIVIGDSVYPLAALPGVTAAVRDCADTRELFEHWDSALPQLNAAAATLGASPSPQALAMSSLRVEPPVIPRQLVCAGANYYKHVVDLIIDSDELGGHSGQSREERRKSAEKLMDYRREHGQPFCFIKPVSTILAPFDDFRVPADSAMPDWELELAVVIGKAGYRIGRDKALEHVAGYTIANDISARDRLMRRDIPAMGMDWVCSKGGPGFCPLGPVIVPAQFIADPQDLWVEFKLNGQVMQSESTADMIFDVAQLIEFISTHMQLLPGDVISTGSPSGNGTHYGRFLTPGDVMEGSISGLGTQRNRCVAEVLAEGAVTHRPFKPVTKE